MLKHWSADKALDHWQKSKLLTKKKADELRLSLQAAEPEVSSKALGLFSYIGAVLMGLGVILFFASNWRSMTPMLKEAVLMAGLIASGWTGFVLAFERKTYVKVGSALLFLNLILFGASVFLVAQMYHLRLNFWLGMLLWSAAAFYFGFALKSRMHVWLGIPLFLFFVGWLRADIVTGFGSQLEFIFQEESGIFVLLPIFGVLSLSLSALCARRPSTQFCAPTFLSWALFLVIVPVVISTVDSSILYAMLTLRLDAVSVTLCVATALCLAIAITHGSYATKQGRTGLVALATYVTFILALAHTPDWLEYPVELFRYSEETSFLLSGLHIVHVLLSFVLVLSVMWFGTLLRRPAIVNLGMLGIALLIMIQYFSLTYSLQNRSFFFMGGGLLLIALSTVLERKRQQILRSFSLSA